MEYPAVSMKKTAPTRKSKMTQMGIMMMNSFTKPEMEAALLLIQLSSDSDRRSSSTTKSGGDDDEFRVRLIKGMDETHQREHSQGSCDDDSKSNNNNNYYYYNCNNYKSEVTSAMSATAPDVGPLAKKDLEEVDEEDDDDVACGPRRMIKKFRSLEELYRLTEPLKIN